ncbi:MAG TPA: nitroreductase family protein [Saprospiraceae bacterium]|nr:nitroreductase family protein [Saprospiraceae bacterium]
MALPEPRPGFGKDKIDMLFDALELYHSQHYKADNQIIAAIKALEAYIAFNLQRHYDVHAIRSRLQRISQHFLQASNENGSSGGTLFITKDEIWQSCKMNLIPFFEHRYSIRQFDASPVALDLIAKAIQMAQKAPSVCNRQSGKVYVFDNDEKGKAVLSCQNGNRGFGHTADKILIITSELGIFLGVGERNQCWIDGGLFAMSLIYALHSLGLGTCCLNWSVEQDVDRKLRRIAKIKDAENIIMLIALGHIPSQLVVARSQRKDLAEVAYFHTAENPIMQNNTI